LDRFIWNRQKAVKNIKNHRIKFEDAVKVFFDPFRAEAFDDENSDDEDRFNTTGSVKGLSYITVSWTLRGELIRVFSARDADPIEVKVYVEHIKEIIGSR
jgi:uncharacterized DUF497 family protein